MVRRVSYFSVVGILLLASGVAHAGTLTSASWLQVIDISTLGAGASVPMTRTLGQLGATGSSTQSSIAVMLSYPFFSTNFFVPKTANRCCDLHIAITQGGPQAITATASMGGGTPGVPGTVIVMTAVHNVMGVNQSMFKVGVNTVVKVPLSHGNAGQFTNTFTVVGALGTITVDFFAWTPGSFVFTGLTSGGQPLPDVTVTGSFNLTPNGGGTVTLVSPSKVSVDITTFPSTHRRTASFTKLTLTFVPEPGLLLLLGGSALAFAPLLRHGRR